MTWTLYNLATHPDALRQCVHEVDSIFQEYDGITVGNISLLSYTEAVLKESLRCHQPVTTLLRTAIEDNILVASDGKEIRVPKGTDIALSLYIVHRLENAEDFFPHLLLFFCLLWIQFGRILARAKEIRSVEISRTTTGEIALVRHGTTILYRTEFRHVGSKSDVSNDCSTIPF